MARLTIARDVADASSVFAGTFRVTWEPGPSPAPATLPADRIAAAGEFVEQLRKGVVDPSGLRRVAPIIATLLGTLDGDPERFLDITLELAATDPALLTEVPWEAAAIGRCDLPDTMGAIFDRLLAHLPISRIVPGEPSTFAIADHRPRLLLCTSNPPAIDTGRLLVTDMQKICEQVAALHPAFHFKTVSARSWPVTRPLITNFQPNVAVIVGHGSSAADGTSPTLAFEGPADPGGEDRVPIADVARALTTSKSCGMAAMIACDLVRASGYSGAWELVRQGIGDVLAMQGSIRQGAAKLVLETFLAEILAGSSVAVAAAHARRAAQSDPHSVLPALFCSAGRPDGANAVAALASTYESALAFLGARVSVEATIQREAQPRVEDLVKRGGVVAVTGGPGNGVSTVLRAAIGRLLTNRQNRPVVYFDCDLRIPGHTLESWMAQQLAEIAAVHPVLLPKTSPVAPGSSGAVELGRWLRDAGISIALDNLPYHLGDDESFARELTAAFAGADRQAGLLLSGAGEWVELAPANRRVQIGPLTLAETEAYVAEFLSGEDAAALLEATGGTLLLLDAERRMKQRVPHDATADAYQQYVASLDRWLSDQARLASLRLSMFDVPLDVRLVDRFIVPELPGILDELVDAGLTRSFVDREVHWITIPARKADAVRARAGEVAEEAAREKLAEIFAARFETAAEATIDDVISLGGGSSFLTILQRHLAATGHVGVAVELPVSALGKHVAAADLFRLFDGAMQVLGALGKPDADVTLAAARAALNIGDPTSAEEWLGTLPSDLEPARECRRLSLKAETLKDREQAAALPQIRDCFERATALVEDAAPDRRAELASFSIDIALDSLPAALFLGHEDAADAEQRLVPVLASATPADRAQFHATLAEREMREPTPSIDWSRVAAWVTKAAALLQQVTDERVRTYCLYQQAQYLRLRPEPRVADAHGLYEQAVNEARTAGEPRRVGLALRHLVELERDHPELGPAGSSWPASRLAAIDPLVSELSMATDDAFSMRVLGRLQLLAGQLTLGRSARRARFTDAGRAFAKPVLSSASDNRQFAIAVREALALDIGEGGDFLLAQRTLNTFNTELERRLAIQVDIDRPEAGRDAISAWLAIH